MECVRGLCEFNSIYDSFGTNVHIDMYNAHIY